MTDKFGIGVTLNHAGQAGIHPNCSCRIPSTQGFAPQQMERVHVEQGVICHAYAPVTKPTMG